MKTLGLLRHAKSDWDDIGTLDFDRGLNDRGRKGAFDQWMAGGDFPSALDDEGMAQ